MKTSYRIFDMVVSTVDHPYGGPQTGYTGMIHDIREFDDGGESLLYITWNLPPEANSRSYESENGYKNCWSVYENEVAPMDESPPFVPQSIDDLFDDPEWRKESP